MTERLLRAVLALAPEPFRSRHTEELVAVHRARAEAARLRGARLFGVRELVGALRLVARLRLEIPGATTTGGGAGILETTVQDLRFAARSLRRNPGFTVAAVAVLALGVGANGAIFGAVNAFLFRPLPFADASRLVMLYETNPEFGWTHAQAAPANVLDWREQVEGFADVAMHTGFIGQVTYLRDGEPELLGASNVTGNFFDVLGVPAALGRGFRWEETWEGEDDVVVLSHQLWVSHFGRDPGVVGRTVELSGTTVEVVGVMPAGFSFPSAGTQLWTPWGWAPDNREQVWFRRAHWVRPIARLAPGVGLEAADAQLQVVVDRLSRDFPETNRVMGAGLMPLRAFMVRDVRGGLLFLLGAVGVLLLLAATNVASLVLVRAAGRAREVGLRRALGAGRGRVVRLLLAESAILAGVGGAVGLALAGAGLGAIGRLTRLGIEGATGGALDHRMVLFTLLAAGASALLFGLAPALRASRRESLAGLHDDGRGASAGVGRLRGVNALVAAEVALALVLVVGAGLMVRSFWLLRAVDPGFATAGTLAIRFAVPASRYQERDDVLAFQAGYLERLEGLPGVERAGKVGQLPLLGQSWSSQFQAEGWPPDRVGFEIVHRRADRGYFEALRIPLIRGRLFAPTDGPDDPLVVVVNATFAREHFLGEDPIGQRIAYDRAATPESTWYEIVGIVGDQHQTTPGEHPMAEVFENAAQDWGRDVWYVMRTAGDPEAAVPGARAALAELDPLVPVAEVRALREVWQASMAREGFLLTLLAAFGTVALLLAAVGVYGVTAQAARARTQEIGIRMALGAGAPDVVGMMLRRGLAVVVVGLAAGLVGSLALSRAVAGFLFGIEPTDPGTLLSVVALLGAVAAAACYLPARRATAVDPVRSLRSE